MITFVTGTDTGVGKTVLAAALAAQARSEGRRVAYLKAVQTGLEPGAPGDAAFVERVAGVRAIEGARFPAPLAPAVAARLVGARVDVESLVALAREEAEAVDLLLVEGAGGLLVPLSDDTTMADYARRLSTDLVVATRAGLGTLNHTALTVEAARRRGLEPRLAVCGWPPAPGITETTNLELLATMAPLMGVVPQVPGLDVEGGVVPDVPSIVASTFEEAP